MITTTTTNNNNAPLYVVGSIAVVAIAAVVLLSIFAPDSGTVTDVLGLAGIMAVQILTNRQVAEKLSEVTKVAVATHNEVNSKMSMLISATKAEGIAEGKEAERTKGD